MVDPAALEWRSTAYKILKREHELAYESYPRAYCDAYRDRGWDSLVVPGVCVLCGYVERRKGGPSNWHCPHCEATRGLRQRLHTRDECLWLADVANNAGPQTIRLAIRAIDALDKALAGVADPW